MIEQTTKNGSKDRVITLLTKIFKLFIFAKDIPTLLNISIIKPLLKDMKKRLMTIVN